MSVNLFSQSLSLTIIPTLQKKLFIIIPHLFVMVLVLTVDPIPNYLRLILFILIVISVVYYYRLHILGTLKYSVSRIGQDSVKNWILKTHDGRSRQVSLLDSSFVSQYLIVLNYIDRNKSNYVVVFTRDSLPISDFRHLIVRLKNT